MTNLGPSPATNVTLTDFPLPSNVQFVSTSAGSFDAANNRVVANVVSLSVGQTATVVIVVRPTTAAVGMTLFNTVAVTADQADPVLTNSQMQVVATQVIAAPGPDVTGPTVLRVHRLGFHARPTRIVLTFNEALDPARAADLANYRLTGPQGGAIPVRSATYDPALLTVTLRPARRLNLHRVFELVVNGLAPTGLTEVAGNLLDGDADAQLGGNFITRIDRNSLDDPALRRVVSTQAAFAPESRAEWLRPARRGGRPASRGPAAP